MGNHPGVAQYKGKWYFFYMNEDLPNGHDKRRAVNVMELPFNTDGSIPELSHTKTGITKPVKNLNPFQKTQAETMAWAQGVETSVDSATGVFVSDISNGDYLKVRSVDFGKGVKQFQANIASGAAGGSIEIRLDSLTGPLAGNLIVKNTGGWKSWKNTGTKIKNTKGVHDVFFVFKGGEGDLFNFDFWKFY